MPYDDPEGRRAFLGGIGSLGVLAAIPGIDACAGPKPFFNQYNLPIGVQLYMLGDAAASDLEGTLQRVADIGYRTIELPGIRAGEAERTRAAADKAGLQITCVHLPADELFPMGMMTVQEDPALISAAMQTLGCRDIVVPFPVLPEVKPQDGEDLMAALRRGFRSGTEHWHRTVELLNDRGAALKGEGLSLGYHNHDIEFLTVLGTRGWDILTAETDPDVVSFELDIAWLVAGGQDPLAVLESLAGRVKQLHVKDLYQPVEPREPLKMESTEVGNGVIDWEELLPVAYRAGARQYYVEQEPPFSIDRFEAASRSFDYLRSI